MYANNRYRQNTPGYEATRYASPGFSAQNYDSDHDRDVSSRATRPQYQLDQDRQHGQQRAAYADAEIDDDDRRPGRAAGVWDKTMGAVQRGLGKASGNPEMMRRGEERRGYGEYEVNRGVELARQREFERQREFDRYDRHGEEYHPSYHRTPVGYAQRSPGCHPSCNPCYNSNCNPGYSQRYGANYAPRYGSGYNSTYNNDYNHGVSQAYGHPSYGAGYGHYGRNGNVSEYNQQYHAGNRWSN